MSVEEETDLLYQNIIWTQPADFEASMMNG
jgi:hypothetical protein